MVWPLHCCVSVLVLLLVDGNTEEVCPFDRRSLQALARFASLIAFQGRPKAMTR